jgi:isocitrate dehydrogenase
MQTNDVAQCRRLITRPGSLQIHRKAFESARQKHAKRVTCCHKANIMKLTDGLFLETFYQVAKEYPEIRADDIIVDDLAMKLVSRPDIFDVIVLPNLQGDIISDLCAGLIGGLGLAPSANIGDDVSIFEAVHGTAPDIAGKNLANPSALLLSCTMMLRHLGMPDRAHMIEVGLQGALAAGVRTGDLVQAKGMKPASTTAFAEGIIKHLPEEAKHVPVNISFTPPVHDPNQQHQMMFTPKSKPERTVGVDIFVDTELTPPRLAEAIKAAAPANFRLTMISNRGTQVWPTGSILTQCVNHYRCRFELDPAGAVGEEEVRLLLGAAEIAKKVHICSMEMLKTIDGKKMFTLAQGE